MKRETLLRLVELKRRLAGPRPAPWERAPAWREARREYECLAFQYAAEMAGVILAQESRPAGPAQQREDLKDGNIIRTEDSHHGGN